jgi:hypothetical protein
VLHLPAHHELRDALFVADLDELGQRTEGDPVASGRQRFDLVRRLFLEANGNYFNARLMRGFERKHRKTPIAGDHPQGHSAT